MSNDKLPTAEETLIKYHGDYRFMDPEDRQELLDAIESHTAAHTAALKQEVEDRNDLIKCMRDLGVKHMEEIARLKSVLSELVDWQNREVKKKRDFSAVMKDAREAIK